ncbi:winged helix DNA-binding domain-containing protein [Microbacterium sp. zg.B48]|uniref:DNA glycosylase AlkZ-like family protein n=1 Tax=Microbacterium sp. zg.B48 TaxID=2969408 RepID=UPI00214C7D64|nr:crosslink repair DNA glycosylase YcaQ family protein [Microbacterium sp. zg.B48]MCR2762296.1 winged helix DNA-binding domain-containing protein [Microbacterium sp. zg.B48]
MHRLTREGARRIAVRAQLLTADRPGGIVEAVDGLSLVNIDPTAAVAPSADHILWSRIGWPYQAADLMRVTEDDRAVFEWAGFYRPMADLPLFRPLMRAWPPYRQHREWLAANDRFRRDVLARLRSEGPLRTGQIPDTSQVAWKSTGWTNNRNVTQMLEFLVLRGEVAISGRDGKERVWDVAERVYPADTVELSAEEAGRLRAERRLGYLGLARAKAPRQPVEPLDVGTAGEEAVVEGVPGSWRVDPTLLHPPDPFQPRTALLSPFDRLVSDRARAQELFDFEYVVEMYKPAAQRRWGYFALPILHGDRLIGKLDAAADRKAGVFRVSAIHHDEPFTAEVAAAVEREVQDLAAWLGLEVTGIPGS